MIRLSDDARRIVLAVELLKHLCGKPSLTVREFQDQEAIVLALNSLRGNLAQLPAWHFGGELAVEKGPWKSSP